MCLLQLSRVLSTTMSYENWYQEVTPPISLMNPDMTGALLWPGISLGTHGWFGADAKAQLAHLSPN